MVKGKVEQKIGAVDNKSFERSLSLPAQCLWILVGLIFGVAPTFFLFIWISLDMEVPLLPELTLFQLPFPTLLSKMVFNFGLFLMWGTLHTLFAQKSFHNVMTKLFPTQSMRFVFYLCNGVTTALIVALWQRSPQQIWLLLPVSKEENRILSFLLFWLAMTLTLFHVLSLGLMEFLGISHVRGQQRSYGTPQLITSGWYSLIRHPIYTFTLIALCLTTHLTLDRLTILLAVITYLSFAIPVEEKKLVDVFGSKYEEYRNQVPAVIPFFGRKSKRA